MVNRGFSLEKRPKCQHKGPRLVRTWFNQPGRAARRHAARVAKAKKLYPSPIQKLRPIVSCCGIAHNMYIREGKGFTVAEVKAVGKSVHQARQCGIAVDYRRVNKSQQSLDRNVQRLKDYLAKLVVFERKTSPEEIKKYVQVNNPLPIVKPVPQITTANVKDQPKMNAYETIHKMRVARVEARRKKLEEAKKNNKKK